MEFKFNILVSTLMFVAVMFVITVHCNSISSPDYEEESGNGFSEGVPLYPPSPECSSLGGLCVQDTDCAELTHKTGLCHAIGVECCYKVISREAPCSHFGGTCTETCGSQSNLPLANDCGEKICCLLTI